MLPPFAAVFVALTPPPAADELIALVCLGACFSLFCVRLIVVVVAVLVKQWLSSGTELCVCGKFSFVAAAG